MGVAIGFEQPIQAQVEAEPNSPPTDFVQFENSSSWPYSASISFPDSNLSSATDATFNLNEVIVTPEVFSKATSSLFDLRLFDTDGKPVPFALRVLRPQKLQQPVAATEFNRDESEKGVHQITLDLLQTDIQHNEIEIKTTGDNFRRAVAVDGSDDGSSWRPLASGNLIRFAEASQKIDIDTFQYSDSRFRFVRVRVTPDPFISDRHGNENSFRFREVNVLHEVDLPGERITLDAVVGQRQGVRNYGTTASAWIIDLGGENVPCDEIEMEIADKQFVRDISVQAEVSLGPLGQKVFSNIYLSNGTTLQRKPGEAIKPMIASFGEIQTGRLRLMVNDYRNTPLTIRSIKYSAAVRQLVYSRPINPNTEVRLFVGNTEADESKYDFARNLSEKIAPAPVRGQLITLLENPNFKPLPKAFLERFPWLIYAVLTTIITILAIVIVSLARSAISLHDTTMTSKLPAMNVVSK